MSVQKAVSFFVFAVLMTHHFFSSPSHAQTINTLQVEFEKRVTSDSSVDILRGKIFYSEKQTYVKIIDPINQVMVFRDDRLEIYYPDEKSAVIMNGYKIETISFTKLFINICKEDFGLSEIGFILDGTELNGDTLTTIWAPNEEHEKKFGPIELKMVNNKLTTIVTRDNKGHVIIKTVYSGHFPHEGHFYPLRIQSTFYEDKIRHEDVELSNPVFDEPIPMEITDFSLPRGTKITELNL